jgi:hypothetical protein
VIVIVPALIANHPPTTNLALLDPLRIIRGGKNYRVF